MNRLAVAAGLVLTFVPALQPRVDAQLANAPDDRYAGLHGAHGTTFLALLTPMTIFSQFGLPVSLFLVRSTKPLLSG